MMLNIKVHKYVGFRSWSRFLAVSLQVTWVINPAVGCHYFPPGLLLPPQPLRGLLFLLWTEAQWMWAVCLRLLPDTVATAIWTWAFCAWFQHANHGFKSGGTKRDSRAKRAKKNVPPHLEKWTVQFLLHLRGTSKQIPISIEYTEICCLVVASIGL